MTLDNYDIILLVIAYLTFTICVMYRILKQIATDKKIKLMTFINLYYMIYYCIVPIFSIINIYNNYEFNYYYLSFERKYYYIYFFISIIFYICINFIWKAIHKENKKHLVYKIDIDTKKFLLITVLFTLIGGGALLLWTKAYGKPWDMIKYSTMVRSGLKPVTNKYTFLKPFCYFSIFAFYNCIIAKKSKYKKSYIILMIINLASSVLYLLNNDGRTAMLIFVAAIILYKVNNNITINPKSILKYFIIIFGMFLFFSQLDNITYFVRHGETQEKTTSNAISSVIINNFSYVYRNGINIEYLIDKQIYSGTSELEDLKNIVYAWVPTRYKENNITLLERNSSYYLDYNATIPSDIITSSLYKFHYVGIIIMSFVLVIIITILERIIMKYNSKYTTFIYNYIGIWLCMALLSSYDASFLLFNCFSLIISFIITTMLCKNKKEDVVNEK